MKTEDLRKYCNLQAFYSNMQLPYFGLAAYKYCIKYSLETLLNKMPIFKCKKIRNRYSEMLMNIFNRNV